MSWEHDHYPTKCRACGQEGQIIVSSDDWNRVRSDWSGVINARIYHFQPHRSTAVCAGCGGTEFDIASRSSTT